MSRFFLGRPIFAWVIAIVIMLAGILSITRLPVSQYPQIAPPQVTITATYPGASAETIENTITQQVEQAMTGLDGYLYMASNSDSSGRVSIDITFEAGTDPDIAQVQVQNRLKTVENSLPQVVQQLGVNVDKSAANFLMVVGFVDKNGKMSSADLSDYLVNNVQEPLSRITGVGEVEVFGSSYSMRIWLDPEKLHKYSLSTDEIVAAIEEQNVQVSSGAIGNLPSSTRYELNATINSMSLLETVADFENIMVKTSMDGSRVLMKDVARIEMGQESYNVIALYNGKESTGMAISLASGANAMATSDRVKARLNEMQVNFPDGMEWVVPFDTTPFVRISIQEVVRTLFEAIDSDHCRAGRTFGYVWGVAGNGLLHQRVNHVRYGACHWATGGRRYCGGGKRRTCDANRRLIATRGNGKIHGADSGCLGGYRHGACGCVRSDGFLRRFNRYHLSPVLRDNRLGHGAFSTSGFDLDAGALCLAFKAD